jgi:hypothetical protein
MMRQRRRCRSASRKVRLHGTAAPSFQALQAALLVAFTAVGCVLVFLLVRRVSLLATCLGVDRARHGSAIIRTS